MRMKMKNKMRKIKKIKSFDLNLLLTKNDRDAKE